MPYQLIAAQARSKALDATWTNVDLSTTDINVIFQTYSKVYLTLSHTSLEKPVYFDMTTHRNLLPIYTGTKTIQDWLDSLGNTALPTLSVLPQLRLMPAKYACAWEAGYSINPVRIGTHPNADLPVGDKHDLLLQKEGVDFRTWWRYCMVTVNGFFHRVGGSEDGLYVVDGARSGRIANNNHVGLYSFREVGALEYIPITPDMIYKTHPDQKYRNHANIKLPRPIEGKTVMLVLGGYLHVLDRTYKQTGPSSIRIDFNNYMLAQRIYDSLKHINLHNLTLTTSPTNPRQFLVEDLMSDRSIVSYLTLPQSFIVVLNTDKVYIRKHYVEKMGLPGRFLAPDNYQPLPLVSELGRVYDYRAYDDHGKIVLMADHNQSPNFNLETRHWEAEKSIDPTRYSSWPWEFARGYLLELGRYN